METDFEKILISANNAKMLSYVNENPNIFMEIINLTMQTCYHNYCSRKDSYGAEWK